MRKNLSFVFVFFVLVISITFWFNHNTKPRPVPVETQTTLVASPAPDFSIKDINGQKISLGQFRGKIVLLHFWASWCAPCVSELPRLLQFTAAHQNNLVLIALSSDLNESDVKKFMSHHKIQASSQNIHLSWDKDRAVTHDLFQTFAYPETIVIDKNGNMVNKIAGDADWTSEDIKNKLLPLLDPLADRASTP